MVIFQPFRSYTQGADEEYGAEVDSFDSESSCSDLSWSSWPEDVPEDDENAVLGEIWLKYRSYRRKWRTMRGKKPRDRFGKPRFHSRMSFGKGRRTDLGSKGVGKSGPGTKSRGNPKGKDGKILKCHIWGI